MVFYENNRRRRYSWGNEDYPRIKPYSFNGESTTNVSLSLNFRTDYQHAFVHVLAEVGLLDQPHAANQHPLYQHPLRVGHGGGSLVRRLWQHRTRQKNWSQNVTKVTVYKLKVTGLQSREETSYRKRDSTTPNHTEAVRDPAQKKNSDPHNDGNGWKKGKQPKERQRQNQRQKRSKSYHHILVDPFTKTPRPQDEMAKNLVLSEWHLGSKTKTRALFWTPNTLPISRQSSFSKLLRIDSFFGHMPTRLIKRHSSLANRLVVSSSSNSSSSQDQPYLNSSNRIILLLREHPYFHSPRSNYYPRMTVRPVQSRGECVLVQARGQSCHRTDTQKTHQHQNNQQW